MHSGMESGLVKGQLVFHQDGSSDDEVSCELTTTAVIHALGKCNTV